MSPEPPLPPGINVADVDEFKRLIARCWIAAGILMTLPLERLDQFSGAAETHGPALYPDIWRANAAKIMQDRELIRVLVQARRDVLVSNPNLAEIPGEVEAIAARLRPRLEAIFRELFGRRELAAVPPLVILHALVTYIARLAPRVPQP